MRALERLGFAFISQEGSHVKLRKQTTEHILTVIVPLHPELSRGTLASILRQASISSEELKQNL